MLLECSLRFVQKRHTRNSVKEAPFVHGQMEFLNISPQAIGFDPSCLGQAYSNKIGTGPEYENTSGV